MMKYTISLILVSAVAVFAAGDMDFAKSKCVSIDGPNLVTVEGLDQIRLVGIQPPGEESKYYDKAVSYLKDKLLGEIVRIEVDPDLPKSNMDQIRAVARPGPAAFTADESIEGANRQIDEEQG